MQRTVEHPSELVWRAQRGSREAFAELVREYHRAVRFYVSRYVGDAHTVDDLSQEVFLAALRAIRGFRGDGTVLSWLLGIAHHKVAHHLRGESRRLQRQGAAVEAAIARWQLASADFHPPAERADETLEALRACIEHLAPQSRRVLDRVYGENQTAEAVAREDNRRPGAVRMMLLRIRRSLAECIRQSTADMD